VIIIQLESFWKKEQNEPEIDDMGSVMINNGKLYYNSSGVGWGNYEELTQKHLNTMEIATFNKMIEDLKKLDKNLDLETINMSFIYHGEYLRNKG
tara:strand:- start:5407 stop:5691 length:285 start_codon:yes stop_codon:yes gene_type:complete